MNSPSKLILTIALAGGLSTAGLAQEMSSSDDTITQSVKATISQHADLKADAVVVQTRQGVVYLTGKVDTPAEKKDLEALAMQTSGVKKVVNNTTVEKGGS